MSAKCVEWRRNGKSEMKKKITGIWGFFYGSWGESGGQQEKGRRLLGGFRVNFGPFWGYSTKFEVMLLKFTKIWGYDSEFEVMLIQIENLEVMSPNHT
jgi:hypothetical protein